MNDSIDILSFCRVLTDLTQKGKCKWMQTPHNSRDRLDFKTGYVEITQYQETDKRKKCYVLDFYDDNDSPFIPIIAEKGVEADADAYKVFGDLYKSIWGYYEKNRNEKIATFYEEIMCKTTK